MDNIFDSISISLLNANELKANHAKLRKYGPTFCVTFDDSGPVGINIIQCGNRVVVCSTPSHLQAFKGNVVHYGDQVLRVGSVSITMFVFCLLLLQ